MGASGLERSICGAAAESGRQADPRRAAGARSAGRRAQQARLIWGHNPASTAPHFMPLLREAQRNGAYVVVIDPRRTITARSADLHIAPRPATDGALALGLMHVLFAEGLTTRRGCEPTPIGWRELRDRAAEYPPERVAAITGLERRDDHRPGPSLWNHQAGAAQIRRRRAAPRQRRPDGARSRLLACRRRSDRRAWRRPVLQYQWLRALERRGASATRSECPPTPRVVNMNRLGAALTGEVADPPIKSLYVFCANPVTSSPNATQNHPRDAARRSLHRRPRAIHDRHRTLRRHRLAGDDRSSSRSICTSRTGIASSSTTSRHRAARRGEKQLGRDAPAGRRDGLRQAMAAPERRRGHPRGAGRHRRDESAARRRHAGTACKPKERSRSTSRPNPGCRSPIGASRRPPARWNCAAKRWPRTGSTRCPTTRRRPNSPRVRRRRHASLSSRARRISSPAAWRTSRDWSPKKVSHSSSQSGRRRRAWHRLRRHRRGGERGWCRLRAVVMLTDVPAGVAVSAERPLGEPVAGRPQRQLDDLRRAGRSGRAEHLRPGNLVEVRLVYGSPAT